MATNKDFRVELQRATAHVFCAHCDREIGQVKASPAELDADRSRRRAKAVEQKIFQLVDEHLPNCPARAD